MCGAAAEILARGVHHQDAGQLVEAVACYRQAVCLDPDLAAAQTSLAAILFAQKRYREAEPICREAVRLQPGSAEGHSNLAAVLALAKPVWLLLAYAPDFRWLLKREDTPWYPTMRLFRQEQPGDWAPVMERVGAALREYAHHR